MKLFNASNTEHKSPVCNYAAALQIKALKTSSGSNVNEAFSPAKQVNGRQFSLKARVLSSSRCVSVPSTSGSIVWHLLTDKTLVKSGWLFRCLSCCTHTHSSGNQLAEAVLHNFIVSHLSNKPSMVTFHRGLALLLIVLKCEPSVSDFRINTLQSSTQECLMEV